jgi:hypothetical protein
MLTRHGKARQKKQQRKHRHECQDKNKDNAVFTQAVFTQDSQDQDWKYSNKPGETKQCSAKDDSQDIQQVSQQNKTRPRPGQIRDLTLNLLFFSVRWLLKIDQTR